MEAEIDESAVEEYVLAFARRAHERCELRDDGETWSHYVALKGGATRSTATVIQSPIDMGDTPDELARNICEAALGHDEKMWAVCIPTGLNNSCDAVPVPKVTASHMSATKSSPGGFATDVMARTMAKMAYNADRRAGEAQGRFLNACQLIMEEREDRVDAEAELAWSQKPGAWEALVHLLPSILPIFLGGRMPPLIPATEDQSGESEPGEGAGAPHDPEAAAELLVAGILGLASQHPEVLTPERLARLAPLLG